MNSSRAVLVRFATPRTAMWLYAQAEAVRLGTGRRLGHGPVLEAICNGLQEAGLDLGTCGGMSDIAAKIAALIRRGRGL